MEGLLDQRDEILKYTEMIISREREGRKSEANDLIKLI